MSGHVLFIIVVIALPVAGFSLWVMGQFLKARRQEIETILRTGLPAEAEILAFSGSKVQYRFAAKGWEHPITVSKRVPGDRKFTVGEKVMVRYLPGHPHISVIVPGQSG